MTATADPLTGWQISKHAPRAKDDAYGGLFFYLRHKLRLFCKRLQEVQVHFRLFRAEATELSTKFKATGLEKDFFDSIEVCLRTDIGYSAN